MKKTIQINIPDPCSQNWDEMTPDHSGRFCAHCQKTVIDFTSYSDTALYQFFSKNNSHVCGRFLSTQLDRPINFPYQPHSQLYRIAIAFGMTLLFTQTPQLLAQHRPPKTEKSITSTQMVKSEDESARISGRALNENHRPIPNAIIEAYQGDAIKGQAITNNKGHYVIDFLSPGYYNVKFIHINNDTLIVTGVVASRGDATIQNFITGGAHNNRDRPNGNHFHKKTRKPTEEDSAVVLTGTPVPTDFRPLNDTTKSYKRSPTKTTPQNAPSPAKK